MKRIKTGVTKSLQNKWPERSITSNYTDDSSSKWYRHIQISVLGHEDKRSGLHYEFNEHEVMFHFEGDFANANYLSLRRYVHKETSGIKNLIWKDQLGHAKCCCKFDEQHIFDDSTLFVELEKLMNIMDPIIDKALKVAPSLESLLTHHQTEYQDDIDNELFRRCNEKTAVRFVEGSFNELMSVNLNIPSYQRNYCWDDNNIENLWNSLVSAEGEIHLGNIILQERNDEFDIIDGQQRLTTLSLFAMALGYKHSLPLLKKTIRSSESAKYIANAKYLIKKLCQRRENRINDLFEKSLGTSIKFGLLILAEGTGLDLAYTFFSSQNSKGVPLSDYDLLKAHHLQYIPQEIQARHLALKWDNLITKHGCDLRNTLGKHLLRLRKWMRWDEIPSEGHFIRDEYVAAPVIVAIPPFGERFDFYEKIQGGTHFFAYADEFVEQYQAFKKTEVAIALSEILSYSTHRHYNDVMETLLFGYYLKFKTKYLSEAFFAISSIIADDRYSSGYMRKKRLMEFAKSSRIIMMIDQATSPTFFLAEAINSIKINPLTLSDEEFNGRRLEFYQELRKGILKVMPLITEESIKNKIVEAYEF